MNFGIRMKSPFWIIVILLILNIPHAGAANSASGWYIGIGAGASEVESDIVLYTKQNPEQLENEERGFAYKFFAGYRVNDYLGIELGWADLNGLEVTGSSDARFASEGVIWSFTENNTVVKADVWAASLGAVFNFPLKKISNNSLVKRLTPIVKIGGSYYDVSKSVSPEGSINYYESQNSTNPTTHEVRDDNGFSWFYGAGLDIGINERFTLQVAYEWYSIEDTMVTDTDFIYGSLKYLF
jgi:opacity protein-like surface antigen